MAEDLKSKIKKKGLRYLIEGISSWYCVIIILVIIGIIVLFFFLLAATGYFKKNNNPCTDTSSGGGTIVIDSGHSPSTGDPTVDPGTNIWIGDNSGADDEVEANFAVSKYIEENLKAQGYQVVLTKNSAQESVNLKKRAEIGSTGTAMVSIHFDPGMSSGGILYPPQNGGKQRGGGSIQKVDDAVAQGGKTLADCISQKTGISTQPDTAGSSANGNITPVGYQPCLVASAFMKVQKILIECPPAKISKQHGATDQTQKDLAKQISDGIAACVPKGGTVGDASVQKVIDLAHAQLGKPYVYGGLGSKPIPSHPPDGPNAPTNFDCSSFVAWCWYWGTDGKINLTPYTYTMYDNECDPISANDVQPGDLLFPPDKHHVGLCIGNGQFIHAPQTGDVVKISEIKNYYGGNVIYARPKGITGIPKSGCNQTTGSETSPGETPPGETPPPNSSPCHDKYVAYSEAYHAWKQLYIKDGCDYRYWEVGTCDSEHNGFVAECYAADGETIRFCIWPTDPSTRRDIRHLGLHEANLNAAYKLWKSTKKQYDDCKANQ